MPSRDWTPQASDRTAVIERPFAGQTALITGAGRGIGRAIALHLARGGADVCLAARTLADLEQVADEAEREGGRAVVVPCDLTEPEQAADLVETAAEKLHGINVLVNNAGGGHRISPLDQLQERTFATGTALNYTAVYRTMHAAARYLFAAAPRAAVLNLVSIAAERGMEGLSYYSGAKSAVVGLSRAAAREWGRHGVRVNCLGPGWIATDLSQPLRDDPEFSTRTLGQIPLGRWGSVDDVAEAAVFLVSDAARYITGATLFVDGGLLA